MSAWLPRISGIFLEQCKKQEEMSLQDVAEYFETLETLESIQKGDPKKRSLVNDPRDC